MNPDSPQTPRDEMEQRLTALLLGELSAEESAVLHRAMEQDGELAKLFARLHHTVGLVRETVASPSEPASGQAAPAKLSVARREQLLAHFKTVAPKEFTPEKRRPRIRLLELAAVLAIIGILAAMLLPALSKAKSKSRRLASVAESKSSSLMEEESADPTAASPAPTDLAYRTWGTYDGRARSGQGINPGEAVASDFEVAGSQSESLAKKPVGVTSLAATPPPPIVLPQAALTLNYSFTDGDADQSGGPLNLGEEAAKDSRFYRAGSGFGGGSGGGGASPTLSRELRAGEDDRSRYARPESTVTFAFDSASAAGAKTRADNFGYFALSDTKLEARPSEPPGHTVAAIDPATGLPVSAGDAVAAPAKQQQSRLFVEKSDALKKNLNGDSGLTVNSATTPATPASGLRALVASQVNRDRGGPLTTASTNSSAYGDLYGRVAPEKSKQIEQINEGLAAKSPEVKLGVKLAEVAQNDHKALGYDGYAGKKLAQVENEFGRFGTAQDGQPTPEFLIDGTVTTRSGRNSSVASDQVPVLGDLPMVEPLYTNSTRSKVSAADSVPNVGRIVPEPKVYSLDVAGYVNTPVPPPPIVLPGAVPAVTPRPTTVLADAKKSWSTDRRQRELREQSVKWNAPALAKQGKESDSDGASAVADQPIRSPSTNAPIPQPEIPTSENNFSTFSLNVSDVSFKLAAASLEKGQLPDAASIRSEEFINAFDYRDPEPAAGAPIAFAYERARYPLAHNRDLLRFSLKTAAAGRQAGRPLNIVVLLDNSGSMERADRVRIIREALRVLAAQLQPQDKLSVIMFARTARLVADGISGDKAGEVAEQVSGVTPQGGTNLEGAMNLAYQSAARHYLANGINRVVLLTDGAANLGDVEPESLKQKVEAQRKQGIALDCFGIGWEGLNDDLLEVLSRNGDGRYGFINSPEEAATDFVGQLAGALKVAASDVKVQVEFNPKRVTTYRQIGYAKHQLTKEQFRDNTVDAAEIAAQEAGNALYTVEVNPAGAGPLCTVRVRYKVPGTTDYREQAWDVPFTGNAPALEQSSPAMRLAASASAFAEWLVASPFAGEVTPDRVLVYLSGVPEVFGADARPKKLEWMIRQAKSLEGK